MTEKNTKTKILAALMAAFTCIATMILKLPTPTLGYIHIGDGLVLLCGFILGPASGALAAGIGSMFADIFSGYLSFAPATCIIKALTAAAAGIVYKSARQRFASAHGRSVAVIAGGILAEAIMVTGYFLYETSVAAFAGGGLTAAALAAGAVSSAAGIPFNIAQGLTGILISLLLLPVLQKVPEIRERLR